MSQAPPALDMKIAMATPETVTPASSPPRASGLTKNPTTTGVVIASAPGSIMRLMAASVEMATHFSTSGCAVPSSRPGISRNWRRTSSIIAIAASPTAFIAIDEKRNGSIAPTKRPAITVGWETSMTWTFAVILNAAKRASAVIAADAMAKPFPMAAVVFPTASNSSVRSRTIGSW